ncbi:MAG: LamG domain-containing protein [Rhodoferax sp.]|nr:LamG domain-containing protein [Rhodoferax sp.]
MRWLRLSLRVFVLLLWQGAAHGATYTNASTVFNWIDPAAHSKIGHLTTPTKFNGGGSTGCGTTPPTLDDTISDAINIGFSFTFGTTTYTSLRVQTNGRLQFGNTTCGSGTNAISPVQTYPFLYPNASMNATMKVFGVDLDPTNLGNVANYPSAARKTTCTSLAVCFVSYASLGSAPNRSFVVTWTNVPEWVSASNTSGSFDLQIILHENGTFVYQYGTISHAGTGSAQIGWQLSTSDFDVLTFGASAEPPPNTAILFYVESGAPLAEYQFEQGGWAAGGAGQVVDSSDGARAGSATGGAQATSFGKVCRAAAIPANTTAAAVDAINTGVRFADVGVNMLGRGTVMFWYRSTAAWSGAGAKAVQLLDASQTSGQWFALTKTASGTLFFEVTDSAGVVRRVETGAQAFAAGTWVHITVRWNFNALAAANSDRIGILINGAAPTESAFTTTGSLSGSLGFLAVGDNPSGLVGTKGSVNSADGAIDELRIYNVELNQGQVGGASVQTHSCNTFFIDHFELRHASWSGLACAPATMTVVACADAACSARYTGGVAATLSSTGAATLWDPSTGGAAIVIGYGQSSVTKSFYTAAGSAILGVAGTGMPVTEASPKKCNGAAGSCTWTSANGGLLLTVPNAGVVTGGKPAAISVQAVQSAGPTPGAACVPVQNLGGAGLKLWSAPVDPAGFSATSTSASVTVGGRPQVASASAGTYVITPLVLPGSDNLTALDFDASATTTVWLRHMDSGQFTLQATLDTSPSASTPALSLSGVAGVTSVPVGYGVAAAAVRAAAPVDLACVAGPSATCDASAGSSARVGSAGGAFSVLVTAALWTADSDGDLTDNPVAPAYAGTVNLAPILAAPAGGAVGSLAVTGVTLAAGSGSTAAQAWTQSGAMRIAVAGTYLTQPIGGQSAVLGRFSPRYFTSTVTTQGCGSFTYSGQPIQTVTVKAMDGSGVPAPSANYRGAFARTLTLSDANGTTAGAFTAHTIPANQFLAGSATASPVFTFTSPRTAPISLALRASDGEVASTGFSEGLAPIRSGRLHLPHAYGSELLPLTLGPVAQYWDGYNYATNTLDNCTVVPASSIAMGNFQKQLAACETQLTPSGNLAFSAGRPTGAGLTLTRPGLGNAGSVDLTIQTGQVAAGNTCIAAAPSSASAAGLPWLGTPGMARATFGVYKSRIIYGRENY